MQIEAEKILKGKVTEVTNFGAFVELEGGGSGLVHISEISNDYVKNINAINDELDELLKNDNVKKYLELSKCDEVREFLKLQDEKDFFRASLTSHRNNLSSLDNNSKKI